MPNGDRLEFVPGGSPHATASWPAPAQPVPVQVCGTEHEKKRAKVAHVSPVEINKLCWNSVAAVVKDDARQLDSVVFSFIRLCSAASSCIPKLQKLGSQHSAIAQTVLRDKLYQYLRRAYPTATANAASTQALVSGRKRCVSVEPLTAAAGRNAPT